MLSMYPGQNAQGSFCHRSSRGLVLGARDFHLLEAAVGTQGHAFRLLLIVLPLQMHQSVEEANVVPIGCRVGAPGPAGTKSEGSHRGRDWK